MKNTAVHRPVDVASEQVFQDRRLHTGTRDGWAKISKLLRQYDERKIQNCKEDIDTLLVFVRISYPKNHIWANIGMQGRVILGRTDSFCRGVVHDVTRGSG